MMVVKKLKYYKRGETETITTKQANNTSIEALVKQFDSFYNMEKTSRKTIR